MKQLQLQNLFIISNPVTPYFLFELLELWQLAFGPNHVLSRLDLNFILKFCTGPPVSHSVHISAAPCVTALLPRSLPPLVVTVRCPDAAHRLC
jgi:hypothetical protein